MKAKTITLDVREDIRQGREPFSKIMSATATLRSNEELLLLAPFEPAPLYSVLAKQGFTHRAERKASGDWEVRFRRGAQCDVRPTTLGSEAPRGAECGVGEQQRNKSQMVQDLDARGLEPPQPIVKILEALASLPAGAELHARTDRRPMHLYAQLETRGFTAQTEEQSDGSFLTHIRRR
jgi:uncharacterized protein (DUF2249 family)